MCPAKRSAWTILAASMVYCAFTHATEPDAAISNLELDSAHVLAARASGFGFTVREVSFPARCISESRPRGNHIALTMESDRTAAWADVTCEHKLFDNRRLQNGWILMRFDLKRRCLVREGDTWKPLAEENCDVHLTRPEISGQSLATTILARLKGSGPLAAQERRLEVTYLYTIAGPADRSPWSARP